MVAADKPAVTMGELNMRILWLTPCLYNRKTIPRGGFQRSAEDEGIRTEMDAGRSCLVPRCSPQVESQMCIVGCRRSVLVQYIEFLFAHRFVNFFFSCNFTYLVIIHWSLKILTPSSISLQAKQTHSVVSRAMPMHLLGLSHMLASVGVISKL